MKRFFSFDGLGFVLFGVRFTLALSIFDSSSSSLTTLTDQSAVSSQYGAVNDQRNAQSVRGNNDTTFFSTTDFGAVHAGIDAANNAVDTIGNAVHAATDLGGYALNTNENVSAYALESNASALKNALDFTAGAFDANAKALNNATDIVSGGFSNATDIVSNGVSKILDFAKSLVGTTVDTLNRTNDSLQGSAAETLKLASVIQDNGKADTQKQNNTTLMVLAIVAMLPSLMRGK